MGTSPSHSPSRSVPVAASTPSTDTPTKRSQLPADIPAALVVTTTQPSLSKNNFITNDSNTKGKSDVAAIALTTPAIHKTSASIGSSAASTKSGDLSSDVILRCSSIDGWRLVQLNRSPVTYIAAGIIEELSKPPNYDDGGIDGEVEIGDDNTRPTLEEWKNNKANLITESWVDIYAINNDNDDHHQLSDRSIMTDLSKRLITQLRPYDRWSNIRQICAADDWIVMNVADRFGEQFCEIWYLHPIAPDSTSLYEEASLPLAQLVYRWSISPRREIRGRDYSYFRFVIRPRDHIIDNYSILAITNIDLGSPPLGITLWQLVPPSTSSS
jgi:hypothetical protein